MFKKMTSIILTFVFVFLFSSCKNSDDSIITGDDRSYIPARDSEGYIITDESGKLKVYPLNENGKKQKNADGGYITEYIDFNGQVVSGLSVETPQIKFTLPEGFVDNESLPGYFSNDSLSGEIYVTYSEDDIDETIKQYETNCENLLESYGGESYSYEKYTIEIEGIECVALKQASITSEFYRNAYDYFVPHGAGFYCVDCKIDASRAKRVNFDKFAQSIEFKNS